MVDLLDWYPEHLPYTDKEWDELQKEHATLRKQLVALIEVECAKQGKTLEDIEVYGLPFHLALPLFEQGRTDFPTFYLFQVFKVLNIPIKI